MKKDEIKLHPKYGLNPTIPVCMYCGEEMNEIAFLGASYKEEAPKTMIMGIEPCEKCAEKFGDFVVLLEHDGKQPTGHWVAVRKECIDIPDPSPIAFMEMGEFRQFYKEIEERVDARTIEEV